MTDKITPQQREAYSYYENIKTARQKLGEYYLDLGYFLKEMKERKLYRYLGEGGYETWNQFLASPEISIKYVTAEVYIQVYRYYVEGLKLPKAEIIAIPLNQLNIMRTKLDKLPSQDAKLEMIEKAKTLGYSDFQKEMVDSGLAKPQKLRVSHCRKCEKMVIEYRKGEVCSCHDKLAIREFYD